MMKKNILFVIVLFQWFGMSAQQENKSPQTVVIQTSAECGECKEKIEASMNYTKGIKFAELDLQSMKLTIKYNPEKISLEQIKEKISLAGYDADDKKADPKAQEKLPQCCKPGGMHK